MTDEQIAALQADLAAARAALQPFADLPSSDGPYITAGDNVKESFYVRTGDIRNARDLLSRLGTGEALAVMRELIGASTEYGEAIAWEDDLDHPALPRMRKAVESARAVFGEEKP